MNVDWLIVGAGFTGATLAERLASQRGERVLLVDQRGHIAGNAYDEHNEHDLLIHLYGPHIFHTNSDKVWTYLSQFTAWRPYQHHVLGVIDGIQVPIPFNLNSLYALFGPQQAARLEDALVARYGFGVKVPILKLRESGSDDLQFLADFIYRNVFLNYTLKQWGLRPEELDASVTGRVPVYISRDNRYFQDTYQAMPAQGYTRMFRRMLDHPNIKVMLNTRYDEIAPSVTAGRVIYTGPIDEYFGFRHGALPYRSLHFDFDTRHVEHVQTVGTVNYPNDYAFTRMTEQKYLSGQRAPVTTMITEYPQPYVRGHNDPYYPVPTDANRALYDRYARDAEAIADRVIFAGRLADYRYYNMDQACARALSLFEQIAAGHPV
ncbi:UDP-galactopyranose mutase [uncultured Deinococcus sp.]|uniref:UDP-galactopyranose mutase n=1 Tax=uncultured Deinococcus sp. TaxID=158789 RepID=UPI0025FA4D2D|nr:UDP-galactopyranose mutase [uncultured Deinococcus sp.]